MATQMPRDPNADRFIEGLRMNDDGGATVDEPELGSDVEELEDGSAIVTMDEFPGPMEDEDFYSIWAESVNIFDLE